MGERTGAELQSKVLAVRELLGSALATYERVTYANSLGPEAVVLSDLIGSHVPGIDVFTIDTGRLNEETYALLGRLQARYANRIRVVYPDTASLERLVADQGMNGFYDSVEARLECCRVRKVEPFRRAIAGFAAWITGIRRRQSADRANGGTIEWDAGHGLYKVSPLLDWRDEDIWGYIRARDLPYNSLLDQGYSSIGCAPCTRAIRAGEDFRAGRWWWEGSTSRECGLIRRSRQETPTPATSA